MVVGKANAKDNVVEQGVKRYVQKLPNRTSKHCRDALLLSVAVAWMLAGERKIG